MKRLINYNARILDKHRWNDDERRIDIYVYQKFHSVKPKGQLNEIFTNFSEIIFKFN